MKCTNRKGYHLPRGTALIYSYSAPLVRILHPVVGSDSGLFTRSMFCQLTTLGNRPCTSHGSTVFRVRGLVKRVKFSPTHCLMTSNDKTSLCGCLATRLRVTFLHCT